MKYAFVLGNHPSLSIIEIFNVLKRENIVYKTEHVSDTVLILDIQGEMNVQYVIKQLGGTIKIIEIIKKFSKYSYKKLFPLLLSYLKEYADVNTRIKFGFSLYLADNNLTKSAEKHFSKRFFKLGMSLKSELKEKGESVKVVVSKETVLSSVILHKQKVLLQGEDFCLCLMGDDSFYLGKTVAYQDFEFYSRLDYGRPARDDKSGMLPPKLAKMMINLAGSSHGATVLDPHCGSGTIVQEALLLGYKNVISSDLSEKAITDSKENVSWLVQNFLDQTNYDVNQNLFVADVTKISQFVELNSVNCIVTEPYMGQGVTHEMKRDNFFRKNRVQVMHELEELYINTFREFKKVLAKDSVVIMIIPAFVIDQKTTIYAQILDQITGLGFEIDTQYDDIVDYSARKSLIYAREGQSVMREIFRLKKN